MSVIITGSIAYDHIMHFPGYFSDHIFPDKIKMLNISFLVDSMKKLRGGCAANIAYSLALLGDRPTVMGTVGEDFAEYRAWMEKNGIDTSLIRVIPDEFTASCFITTDQSNNQITGFYPGAMGKAHMLSFKEMDTGAVRLVIISPNDPAAMIKYFRECKELSIPFIFDPGHQIPRLAPEDIIEGIKGSCYTIVNDYELQMILNRTGKSEHEIVAMTGSLIVTKGAEGSIIKSGGKALTVPPVAPERILDPTGSGDAYRSAIIKAHLEGFDLMSMGKLASLVATYVVETPGPTEHHFTVQSLKERYRKNYGEELPL